MWHAIGLGVFFAILGASFFIGAVVGCIAGFVLSEIIDRKAIETECDYGNETRIER